MHVEDMRGHFNVNNKSNVSVFSKLVGFVAAVQMLNLGVSNQQKAKKKGLFL